MDQEIEAFQNDLLESVRQMKSDRPARLTHLTLSSTTAARHACGLSQAQFAVLMGVSVRTLRDWELGRREPSGAARTLLKVAERHPDVLRELAA